jgi:hypothetical protein
MQKLLTMGKEGQTQKRVPLGLMTIKAKASSLFEGLKKIYPEGIHSFSAGRV